jgi:hypothetical protein
MKFQTALLPVKDVDGIDMGYNATAGPIVVDDG